VTGQIRLLFLASRYHILAVDVNSTEGTLPVFASDLYPAPPRNALLAVRDWHRSPDCSTNDVIPGLQRFSRLPGQAGDDAVATGCVHITDGSVRYCIAVCRMIGIGHSPSETCSHVLYILSRCPIETSLCCVHAFFSGCTTTAPQSDRAGDNIVGSVLRLQHPACAAGRGHELAVGDTHHAALHRHCPASWTGQISHPGFVELPVAPGLKLRVCIAYVGCAAR
jgi:hypothetical protein